MISLFLKDGGGRGSYAGVSDAGELRVAPFEFSTPEFRTLTAVNVPSTFFDPKPGHRLILTDFVIYANRNVGVNDATLDLYEAIGSNTTAVIHQIFKQEIPKQTILPQVGLNWVVTGGTFLNARTNDVEVFMTVAGYFQPIK